MESVEFQTTWEETGAPGGTSGDDLGVAPSAEYGQGMHLRKLSGENPSARIRSNDGGWTAGAGRSGGGHQPGWKTSSFPVL